MKNRKLEYQSAFITGANGGMGFETSKLLVKHGVKKITLAARTIEKANSAKTNLISSTNSTSNIEAVGGFDMNNPYSIEKAVKQIPKDSGFDIIFFQVGGVFFTKDYQFQEHKGKKIEKTIFQNVIGSYVTLINLMEHGLVNEKARIVFAGGEGARGIPGLIEKPVFESVNEFRQYIYGMGSQKKYNPMNAIGVSKLTSALLSQKLAELEDGNEYIWFSPGLTHGTNGLKSVTPIKRFFMEKIMFGISGLLGFLQSPKKGAQKYFNCLVGNIGKNGDVLGAPEGKVLGKITDQKPMNNSITNKDLREEFWKILEETYAPFIVAFQ